MTTWDKVKPKSIKLTVCPESNTLYLAFSDNVDGVYLDMMLLPFGSILEVEYSIVKIASVIPLYRRILLVLYNEV